MATMWISVHVKPKKKKVKKKKKKWIQVNDMHIAEVLKGNMH